MLGGEGPALLDPVTAHTAAFSVDAYRAWLETRTH